ncbi:MAG TPA: plastocyanin/azurin family copper-binding protein [Acidimicrobiia bacterium]|nr:plastocyanin/azurin family copper-binding protein [Acidimicrobiia bacterium]
MSSVTRPDAITAEPAGRGLTWRRLLFIGGIVATVAIGTISAVLGDLEGGAVALGFALATWLTRVRRGTLGATGVALAGAITLYFMLTAAMTNIREGSPMSSVLISSIVAAVSLLALIAAIGFFANRASGSTTGPWLSMGVCVLLLGVLLVWGASISRVEIGAGDIALVSENLAFSETELKVNEGSVVVTMENRDLFWHTFTVDELGVDLRVPVGAELGASFDAAPGQYQFVCAIPGHVDAGMVGTLTVES